MMEDTFEGGAWAEASQVTAWFLGILEANGISFTWSFEKQLAKSVRIIRIIHRACSELLPVSLDELHIFSLSLSLWFEMGGTQLEKDDVTLFWAPIRTVKVQHSNLMTLVGFDPGSRLNSKLFPPSSESKSTHWMSLKNAKNETSPSPLWKRCNHGLFLRIKIWLKVNDEREKDGCPPLIGGCI